MRVLRHLLPILVAAALLAWGWAYDAPASSRPFVSGDELSWMRTFEAWLSDANDLVDESRADAAHPATARLLGECLDFEDRIDEAPTDRLAAVRRLAERACVELTRFRDTARSDPTGADRRWRRADDLLFDADDAAYGLLGYTGPLPRDPGEDGAGVVSRLSTVASDWVGYDLDVRCFPSGDWYRVLSEHEAWWGGYPDDTTLGFVDWDYDRVVLGPVCAELVGLINRRGNARPEDEELAEALGTFAHEVAHLDDPDADEDEVECAAVQRVEWTARRLGVSASTAAGLARTFWTRVYPDGYEEYQSDECRDGGELDEHPRTAGWP